MALGTLRFYKDHLKKELGKKSMELLIIDLCKKVANKLVEDLRRPLKRKEKIIFDQSSRIEELHDQVIDVEMQVDPLPRCRSCYYSKFGYFLLI